MENETASEDIVILAEEKAPYPLTYVSPSTFRSRDTVSFTKDTVVNLCDSVENEYVPLYAMQKYAPLEVNGNKMYFYNKWEGDYHSTYPLSRLKTYLTTTFQAIVKTPRNNKQYIVRQGFIADNKIPLMAMCVRSNAIEKTIANSIVDPKDAILLLNRNFGLSEEHKSMYKKTKAEYIDNMSKLGIDLMITNSIEEKIFKIGYKEPKFNNLIELKAYLNGLNDMIL